jgi:hypothetical protein
MAQSTPPTWPDTVTVITESLWDVSTLDIAKLQVFLKKILLTVISRFYHLLLPLTTVDILENPYYILPVVVKEQKISFVFLLTSVRQTQISLLYLLMCLFEDIQLLFTLAWTLQDIQRIDIALEMLLDLSSQQGLLQGLNGMRWISHKGHCIWFEHIFFD